MEDVLCYSVDAESRAGRVIARKYGANGFPALFFLEPDGTVRDKIGGFMPPEPFLAEVQRIKRNESTLSSLRKQVAENPKDLDLRWKYAQKLGQLDDKQGREREIAFILKNDPEGISIGARTLKFLEIKQASMEEMDFQGVYDFLEKESDVDLLVDGWFFLFQVESYLADNDDEPERAGHRKLQVSAARALWSHVPERLIVRVGNELTASLLDSVDQLASPDRAFMVEIANAAARQAPEDDRNLAMYGACLFAAGRKDEAIEQLKRCLEIAPRNARWRDQLAKYEKAD
jgi:tetratricopeptide (TPR) repeat protein